jgi:8-oxo-dGTP diphosphatase
VRATAREALGPGSLLYRLAHQGIEIEPGYHANLPAEHVLPGCLRRLWRHVTLAGHRVEFEALGELAVWAEKATYAAEGAAKALGEQAVALATATRQLWTLLAPAHALATSQRIVGLHLNHPAGRSIVEVLEHAARDEWERIADAWTPAVRAVAAEERATITPRGGQTIRGGGGVVVRNGDGRLEVLLVHRLNRVGWSLPKGKCRPGESARDCALREVREETSLTCVTGGELATMTYRDRNGRLKTVSYWLMRPVDGEASPSGEVDDFRWVPLGEAKDAVTKDRERQVLAEVRRKVAAS